MAWAAAERPGHLYPDTESLPLSIRAEVARDHMGGATLEHGPLPGWRLVQSARYHMHDALRPTANRQRREIPFWPPGGQLEWRAAPSLERTEDEVAVWQVWRGLSPEDKLNLVTHFASTGQDDAAELRGVRVDRWRVMLAGRRRNFARLWLGGEPPAGRHIRHRPRRDLERAEVLD